MSKHAVRVAVRNVVRVVTVPPQSVKGRTGPGGTPSRLESGPQSQLLSGVSWDDGRRVWLVHPAPVPARG